RDLLRFDRRHAAIASRRRVTHLRIEGDLHVAGVQGLAARGGAGRAGVNDALKTHLDLCRCHGAYLLLTVDFAGKAGWNDFKLLFQRGPHERPLWIFLTAERAAELVRG